MNTKGGNLHGVCQQLFHQFVKSEHNVPVLREGSVLANSETDLSID